MLTAQVIELCVETSVRKKYVSTTQPERPFHLDLKLQNHDKNYSEFLLMIMFIAAFFNFFRELDQISCDMSNGKKDKSSATLCEHI